MISPAPDFITRLALRLSVAALAITLPACSSSDPGIKGLPSNLPTIPLYDSPQTPAHSMPHADYPFSPDGNYVTAWAAEGGVRASSERGSGSHHSEGRASSSRSKGSSSSRSKSSGSSRSKRSHVVKSTDSLYTIAKRYGTTVAKIKSANGLKSDLIRDGRRLVIP